MAASPAIRQNIPTRPREGSTHGLSATGIVAGSVLMFFLYNSKNATRDASLVLPVRIFRMLDVPQWPAAPHLRQNREVVVGGRRRSCPLERPRIPRIVARQAALKVRPHQIKDEAQYSGGLEERPNADNQVPTLPTSPRLVGVDSARHSEKSRDVHEIEGEMKPDHKKPEVPLAQFFVQHPAGHFWKPIVERRERREKDSSHDHVVEMRHHKIRAAQLPVYRSRTKHDSRQPGNQELEQECDAEQHRRGIADLAAPHRTQPIENLDARGHRNGRRRQYKEGVSPG